MHPVNRSLIRKLSDAGPGLELWQQDCREAVHNIYEESFKDRKPIAAIIQALPWPSSVAEAKVELELMAQVACGLSQSDAQAYADIALQFPLVADHLGFTFTNVYHWRIDDQSLWRGQSDTAKVCGLAKSILCTGFHRDSTVCSRDHNISGLNCLRFGDGQARGLALRLAWAVIRTKVVMKGMVVACNGLCAIFESMMAIPTCFEKPGDEGTMLVRQVVRQNIKAQLTLPVNTIEWARIIMQAAAPIGATSHLDQLSATSVEARKVQSKRLLDTMMTMLDTYHKQIEDEGVDMAPAAKRARKGRRKSGAAVCQTEEGVSEDRLKLGTLRQAAIKNILQSCTAASFKDMEMHLVWAGDFKSSVLSDATLAWKHWWPGSHPSPAATPTALQEQVRVAASKAGVPTRYKTQDLMYDVVLTMEMHEMVLQKAIHIFEDEALHLPDPTTSRSKFRPTTDVLDGYRIVNQHWVQSIKYCALADLQEADFKELELAVLYGDAMDAQIQKALVGFPVRWNMAMLPDLKSGMDEDMATSHESLLEQAEAGAWKSKLTEFDARLKHDQAKIRSIHNGAHLLADHLEWLQHFKLLQQAKEAEKLTMEFTKLHASILALGWMLVLFVPRFVSCAGFQNPFML